MNKNSIIQALNKADKKGRYVFSLYDLKKILLDDSPKTRKQSLYRLVKGGWLSRACRGVYVNEHAQSFDSYVIEYIAKALRRGEYSYVSLESALSEYGVISQIPIDRITVMTTGRSALYETKYGIIEFVHTERSRIDIINSIQTIPGRPLRIAKKETALRDLKRVGRNLHLVNFKEMEDD